MVCNCCFDMEDTKRPTGKQKVETSWVDTLPRELVAEIRSYLSQTSAERLSAVNQRSREIALNHKHDQYKTYLHAHPQQYWAALVHSYGQLKQNDMVSPVFLAMVTIGDVCNLEYLLALAKHHVHPVHVVHYLLRYNEDKALRVVKLIWAHQPAFFCAFACMNVHAQTKVDQCKAYSEHQSINDFLLMCNYHRIMYNRRIVHHIEKTDNTMEIWYYNLQTVWSAAAYYQTLKVRSTIQKYKGHTVVSVQRNSRKIFYQNTRRDQLMLLQGVRGRRHQELYAVNKETVKALLTNNGDVLLQLLRSGNIHYYNQRDEEHSTIGLDTGPYVDIMLAAVPAEQFVDFFALSSKGKVYRVFLNAKSDYRTCDFVEIPLQDDVPVVQMVGLQNSTSTPFYLVTRDAENKLCVCTFTQGTRQFEIQTKEFQTRVVTRSQNIVLMPKTMHMSRHDVRRQEDLDDLIVSFKELIIAIGFRNNPRELKFCFLTQQFERTWRSTVAENRFQITSSDISYLEPIRVVPGFDINDIVEMVQVRQFKIFCLMSNGTVFLCTMDLEENNYTVDVVPNSLPTLPSQSGPNSAGDAPPWSAEGVDFRLRLRLSK